MRPLMLNTLNAICERLSPGSQLIRMWQLDGGISAQMTAFECRLPDRLLQRFVVRQIQEHDAQYEFKLLQYLNRSGLPIARPHVLDLTKTLVPDALLVLDYLPGSINFSRSWSLKQVDQAAHALAQLHQYSKMHPIPHFVRVTPYQLDAYTQISQPGDDWAIDVQQIFKLLEQAWPLPRSHSDVLLHGDFWPGNMLWHKDILSGLIDWEDAQVGDPLYDLAIARLDIRCMCSEEMMHHFTAQYLSYTHLDSTMLAWWDLIAVVRMARMINNDLAGWVSFFVPYNRHDLNIHTLRIHLQSAIHDALRQINSISRAV